MATQPRRFTGKRDPEQFRVDIDRYKALGMELGATDVKVIGKEDVIIDERVIEHALVIAAHDHLQRGIQRREWWADRLAPSQPTERPPG